MTFTGEKPSFECNPSFNKVFESVKNLFTEKSKTETTVESVVNDVEETVETAQLSAPNYTIICEECDVMEVYGDRTRLEQVLMNLLNNAVKYTPNPADRIRVIVKKTDTEIITSIYDHGIGVPVDQTEKIFERFYRAKSASRVAGLGIGLYVSKQIVERHKGRMWVENNEEGGSIFSFALPLEVQL